MSKNLRWSLPGSHLGVCLLLVLFSASVGHAQGSVATLPYRPNYIGGEQPPAATTMDGPWQLTQSDFERTPDARAREAVASTLGLLFQYYSPTPQILAINVMGRTATARAQMNEGKRSYLALIQLRFQMNTWLVTEIIPQ